MLAAAAPSIALESIARRFGDCVAVADASLTLQPGEVHALVGENGAGKTTLMRILTGMIPPDAGAIRIDGHTARLKSPNDALKHGLGMVHQDFLLVGRMTGAQNVVLGREPRGFLGGWRRAAAERAVADLAARV